MARLSRRGDSLGTRRLDGEVWGSSTLRRRAPRFIEGGAEVRWCRRRCLQPHPELINVLGVCAYGYLLSIRRGCTQYYKHHDVLAASVRHYAARRKGMSAGALPSSTFVRKLDAGRDGVARGELQQASQADALSAGSHPDLSHSG